MSTTTAPASVPEERTSEETISRRNERLYLGNKELKFVIKLSIPIPV